jgi:hypothetical protein
MRITLLLCALLALAACGGSPDDHRPAEDGGAAAADTTVRPHEAALSRAQRLDESLAFGAGRSATALDDDGRERDLRLWDTDGVPQKLTATEPGPGGRMTGTSTYYFEQGELFLAHTPEGRFVFDGRRVATVLDERLRPVDAANADRTRHEQTIRADVERYLAAFAR